jgi:CheY-like chemotaxis protein
VPHPQNERKIIRRFPVSKSIILGEDDIDDEEFLKELFSSVDGSFSLTFIHNGREVIEYLAGLADEQLPCLIVLDYNMPAVTGAEILQELQKQSRYDDIPKIIWSTSPSDMFRKKCLESGADDYVIKPSSVHELLETIQYMISFC